MGLCDFHTHSTASDGKLTPTELVNEAVRCKLDGYALSDHDTFDGINEAALRSKKLGLFYIPAVELSVDLHSGGNAHLLGYFPGADLSELCDKSSQMQLALQVIVDSRNERNPAIVQKFRDLGFDISMEEIAAEAKGVVGRPHIAAVLIKKGLISSSEEVFNRYLAAGKPAYVDRKRLGDFRAIELIRQSGGFPVLAHPKYIQTEGLNGLRALISSFTDAGLFGIETYYPEQSGKLVNMLKKTADSMGLVLTGGSDFHGIKQPLPGWEDGTYGVPTDKLSKFIEICKEKGEVTNGKIK